MECQVSYLALFCFFLAMDGFKWFWMESLTQISSMLEFLLYINDLPDDVIFSIAIYADDTTLYSKWDQASDMRQQLELPSELESEVRDTVDRDRKWFVSFNVEKSQL